MSNDEQLRHRIALLEAENSSLKAEVQRNENTLHKLTWRYDMLETLASEASVILFAMDSLGRLLLYSGKGMSNIGEGVASETVIGKSVFDIYKKDMYKPFLDQCRLALSGSYCRKIVERGKGDGFFDVILSPVRNDENQVVYVIGVSNDVTSIVLTERALAKSEEKYRSMAENSRDMMYHFSIEGFYDYVSPSSIVITGYTPEEWYSDRKLLKKIIHPAFFNGVREAWNNLKNGIVAPFYEYQIYHKSGDLRWVRQRNFLATDEHGVPTGIDGDITDITEIKKSEKHLKRVMARLKRSNEDLDEFATAASHDLQEPLMVISNFIQLLIKDYSEKLDDNGRKFLKYVFDASTRMRGLLLGLLEYSRLTAEKHYWSYVTLRSVIDAAVENVYYSIEKQNAQIILNVAEGNIYCDPSQISRLITNIIANSLKFCKEDQNPIVEISASIEKRKWKILIKDNGIGIKKEDLGQIFQIFRCSSHDPEKYKGTGVGLAMVRKIAERHGGSVSADSVFGEGSVFTITLPVK